MQLYKKEAFIAFVIISLLFNQSYSKDLVIKNSKESVIAIFSQNGDILSNLNKQEDGVTPRTLGDGSLRFNYSGKDNVAFTNENFEADNDIKGKGSSSWPTTNTLSFSTPQGSKKVVVTSGGDIICGNMLQFIKSDNGDEPNFKRTITYLKSGKKNPIATKVYFDAFGREIQAQTQVGIARYIVSGNYYDKFGRLSKSTLAAPLNTLGKFQKMEYSYDSNGKPTTDKLLNDINDYYVSEDKYPEAGRYAFSEIEYHNDPSNRIVKTSSPGYDHRINGGHDVKSWTFGISDCKIENFVQFNSVKDGSTSDLYDIDVEKANTFLNNKKDDGGAKYLLKVIRDLNNKFSQTIVDTDGKTLKTASFYKGKLLVSSNEYDALGNVLRQNPPDENSAPSLFKYNSLGQVVESWDADKGTVTYTYNKDGSVKSKTDAKGLKISYSYDKFGRLIKVSNDNTKVSYIEKFYDFKDKFNMKLTTDKKISNILSELTYIRGKLFAEVSISNMGNVIDMYSYDEEGRIEASYRLIPNMEWQKIKLSYNFSGNVESEIIYPTYLSDSKNNKPICKSYHYDEFGRLIAVKVDEKIDSMEDDKLLTTIEYDDMKVVSQTFYDCKSGGAVYTRTTEDNILGWITKIKNKSNRNSTMLFEEVITHDGFYDGNISAAEFKYNLSGQQKNIKLNYKYDELTRLTGVTPASSVYSQYEEAFGYDNNSRLTYKVKNGSTPSDTYEYQSLLEAGHDYNKLGLSNSLKSNRLSGFSDNKNNYTYDASGGMILDKSKDLSIQRDWRGMPIMMKLREGQGSFANVSMLYDANGNRVLKKVLKADEHSAIAYSIGGLIYHNENLDEDVKDYNLLSANIEGGRVTYYDEINKSYSDNFLSANFYLKDHLGSTRMSISGNGGVASSEFYYAYGGMDRDFNWNPSIDLMKVREQFTGKEFDTEGEDLDYDVEGINLTYFGARYYDPEVGVWLSTDAASQFYNSYGYATNPIIMVDPDGNYVIGAIVGGLIGGYMGGVMSSGSFNPGDWEAQDWFGAVSGAISGAMRGSEIENAAFKQYYTSTGNAPRTAYGQRVFSVLIKADLQAMANTLMVSEMDLADAYLLNESGGAGGFGHNAGIYGNDELGYYYGSKDGIRNGVHVNERIYKPTLEELLNTTDPTTGQLIRDRYDRILRIKTTPAQDWEMIKYMESKYKLPYSLKNNNCGDLMGRTFEAGGLEGYHRGWFTMPNNQYLNHLFLGGTIIQ